MLRKLFCLLIPLIAVPAVVSAQVKLEPKYPEGAKSIVQNETTTKQTLVLAGMNIDTKARTFGVGKSAVGKRAADGTLEVVESMETMQSEISLPGGLSINFDSANPDKKASNPLLEPILDSFRTISRQPIIVQLDSKNNITKVRLPDGEFEKLTGLAKDQLSPEWLKKGYEKALAHLPSEAVKVGDKWERSLEMNPGDGQVLTFRTQYEYAGTVQQDGKTLDKITNKVLDVSYVVNGNGQLQVKNAELKVVDSSGTFLFDRERGATVSRMSKVQVAGPVTLVINGMELPGSVDLTIEENATLQK